MDPDGINAITDAEKANVLKGFFESVHRADTGSTPATSLRGDMPPMGLSDITTHEVAVVLRGMDTGKAEGPDGIHPAVLKPLAEVLATPLAEIFNQSITESRLPRDWLVAEVVPIHKGGAKEAPENYRPVSLLSTVLKVLEKILRDRLAAHVVRNGLISPRQHGFMNRRSCLTNLLTYLNEVTVRLDQGCLLYTSPSPRD